MKAEIKLVQDDEVWAAPLDTKVKWSVFVNDEYMGSTPGFPLSDAISHPYSKERVELSHKNGIWKEGTRVEYRLVRA